MHYAMPFTKLHALRHILTGDYHGKLDNTINSENIALETREKIVTDMLEVSELYKEVKIRLKQAYEINASQYNLRKRDIV